MKIVILDGFSTNPGDLSWEGLEPFGELTIYDRTPSDPEEIIKRIGDAEIVLQNKMNLSREIMDRCPRLRYIGELATGYNNVDITAAKEKGIVVANVPAYSSMSVAQNALALLLEITHHVGAHTQKVLEEKAWINSSDPSWAAYPLMELDGKTLGIIGLGQIGQAVARVGKALGMKVIAYSRSVREEGKALAEYVSLDELLSRSDVVSLHCPLFPETKEIIDRKTIAKMKNGAILINTSRGGLVNEEALAEALNSGKLCAAGVDVVSVEPMREDNPLLNAKNLFVTPHIGWMTKEARSRLIAVTVENLKCWIEGDPRNNVAV